MGSTHEIDGIQAVTRTTFVIAWTALWGSLLVGYNTGIMAGALEFIAVEFPISTIEKSVVVTAILVGGFLGGLLCGLVAERFGQRPVLLTTALVYTVSAVACAFADSIATLIAWRFVMGFAVGASTMVLPEYVAETSPARWRGVLVSITPLAITSGFLLAYLADYSLSAQGDWRGMLGSGVIPGTLMLLGLTLAPESPDWLLCKGRVEEARAAYLAVHGIPWPREALEAAHCGNEHSVTWSEVAVKPVRGVLIVGAGLFLLQNLSGIDAILYYAPEIFKAAGFASVEGRLLSTVGLGAVNVLATVASAVCIDRWGRRPLLLWGLAAMTLGMGLFAATHVYSHDSVLLQRVQVAALSVFIGAFAFGMGAVPYILASEIFPLRVRSRSIGLCSAAAWGINIVVILGFLPLVELSSPEAVFGFFTVVNLFAFFFCLFLVPETKGRSLESIEKNLVAGMRTRDLGKAIE
jgi:MFS transporter, SP family, galactose:H+ symporter